MLGYKLMAFVGLRNAEGPNAVRIMDMEKYYGLWMEVHVFRLNFGLRGTDLKCYRYNFTRYFILVCTNHDFKLLFRILV